MLMPEVAFLGRSNSGKSSLLNHLTQNKKLSRVGQTPGVTREILFFESKLGRFVDLPGYGFAKVGQLEQKLWTKLIETYLSSRDCLKGAVILSDVRRELSDDEQNLLDYLHAHNREAIVVLTKVDKLTTQEKFKREQYFRSVLGDVRWYMISNVKKKGIDQIHNVLFKEWLNRK